jgi:hypothetical protein
VKIQDHFYFYAPYLLSNIMRQQVYFVALFIAFIRPHDVVIMGTSINTDYSFRP